MSVHYGGRGPGHLSRWTKAVSASVPTPNFTPVHPAGGDATYALWTASEAGGYYDFTDATSLYKTTNGQANPSADSDTVGYAFNAALMGGNTATTFIAAQSNLLSNAGFDTDLTGWSGAAWSYSSGKAQHTAGTATAMTQVIAATTSGKSYYLEGTISGRTAGVLALQLNTNSPNVSANGTTKAIQTGAGGTNFGFKPSSAFDGAVDNAVCKAVSLHDASQSTAGNRPTYHAAGYVEFVSSSSHYLTTNLVAGSSGGALGVRGLMPASAGTFIGAKGAGSDRWSLGITVDGYLTATCGSVTLTGTTDVSGLWGAAMVYEDGANVYLLWRPRAANTPVVVEDSAAYSGAATTSVAIYLGCYNNNGTPAEHCDGIFEVMTAYTEGAPDENQYTNFLCYGNV